MTKEILETAIQHMPQEFNLDERFERLVFIEEIKTAQKEVHDGKAIPLEEVMEIVKGWRK